MKYWKKLSKLSKIVFVFWTMCSLIALFAGEPKPTIGEWIGVSLFGYFLFLIPSQAISFAYWKLCEKSYTKGKESNIAKEKTVISPKEQTQFGRQCAEPEPEKIISYSENIAIEEKKTRKMLQIQKKKEKTMSQYDIERYAAMCNAYLEHQEEMEQYENLERY